MNNNETANNTDTMFFDWTDEAGITILKMFTEKHKDTAKKAISDLSDVDVTNLAEQLLALHIACSMISKISESEERFKFQHDFFKNVSDIVEVNIALALNGRNFRLVVNEDEDTEKKNDDENK